MSKIITYQDLTNMAKSSDANERKRGFGLFQAWIKKAPQLQDSEKLTQMERDILTQIFEQRGLISAARQKQIEAKKRQR
jgi:hypothetical protein